MNKFLSLIAKVHQIMVNEEKHFLICYHIFRKGKILLRICL